MMCVCGVCIAFFSSGASTGGFDYQHSLMIDDRQIEERALLA
jgi:hypothetical protein